MEIFFLGTGTSIPVLGHSPAGLLVKAGGCSLLFDIGPGTLGRLHFAGLDPGGIDHLLLTHFHPDHTLDLAALLLVFNYAPGAQRTASFPITAGGDVQDFCQRMFCLYPDVAPASFDLEFHPVHRDRFSIGSLRLESAPTGHTPESVAYRLDDGKHSLVYSGDAAPGGELAALASGCDLLISECSFPSGWKTEDHLNADTLGAIAQQAAVKSLIVVHCYPPALDVDLAGQIRSRYAGEVRLAYDGLHISL